MIKLYDDNVVQDHISDVAMVWECNCKREKNIEYSV